MEATIKFAGIEIKANSTTLPTGEEMALIIARVVAMQDADKVEQDCMQIGPELYLLLKRKYEKKSS